MSSPSDNLSAPGFLVIGKILRPHGIRGELRVQIVTSFPERFKHLETLILATDPEQPGKKPVFEEVERVRLHQGTAILKLAGIEDRNQAETLRDQYVMVPLTEAVPLEEGEYYYYQLIGLAMVTDSGDDLGLVTDILETGANDVYVVQGPRYGEVLIPAIESVIKEIDLTAKRITVTLLPGLLPDS